MYSSNLKIDLFARLGSSGFYLVIVCTKNLPCWVFSIQISKPFWNMLIEERQFSHEIKKIMKDVISLKLIMLLEFTTALAGIQNKQIVAFLLRSKTNRT